MGAKMGVLAVIAALACRDRTGRGQYIDLSMQDIAAWLTQAAWNEPGGARLSLVACCDGHALVEADAERAAGMLREAFGAPPAGAPTRREAVERIARGGGRAAPVLTVHEMLAEPHTSARGLWFEVADGAERWPLLASPLRLTGTPPAVRRPMAPLGRDTAAIVGALREPPGS